MVTWTPLDPVETALFLTDRVRYFGTSGGATKEEVRDLASELKILIYIGEHKNIVNLLGACIKRDRILVILEYAPHGSLQKFLRGKRDVYEATWTTTASDPEIRLNISNLVGYAYQISRGMEYLASKKVIFPPFKDSHIAQENSVLTRAIAKVALGYNRPFLAYILFFHFTPRDVLGAICILSFHNIYRHVCSFLFLISCFCFSLFKTYLFCLVCSPRLGGQKRPCWKRLRHEDR